MPKTLTVTIPDDVLHAIDELAAGKAESTIDPAALKKLKDMKLKTTDAAHPQGLICDFDLHCWVV